YGPRIAMVFQDPMMSLHPVLKLGSQLTEGLRLHKKLSKTDARRVAVDLLRSVRIPEPESRLDQYPHELSGGMRQRVGIARALALRPDLLIADEPVSAVDVSTQAQILNLLADMRRRFGLTVLLISHDLAVVRRMCDRVGVMYLGKLVETAPSDALYSHPRHPYTAALLASVPRFQSGVGRGGGSSPAGTGGSAEQAMTVHDRPPVRAVLRGEVPSAASPPSGCRFHPRCPKSTERCAAEEPVLAPMPQSAAPNHTAGEQTEALVACHYPLSMEEVLAMGIGSGS
ncbi:MAG: ABC transporter ATP-binding protein, partial [Solirubrobacteraceae bacterium]